MTILILRGFANVRFARHQLANLKQHIRISAHTQSQYLQTIETAKDWDLIIPNGGIYQLYYHARYQYWEAYQFAKPINRRVTASTILTIYKSKESYTYHWCCPHIDAVVTERNFDLLNNFLSQDLPLSTQL